jgi:Polyketide cyclase / dehydrase and lipid transport
VELRDQRDAEGLRRLGRCRVALPANPDASYAKRETFEVTEFEPDHSLSIRGPLGPFQAEVAYVLAPAERGTVLTNTMHLQPSGPLRLVAPLAAPGVKSAVAANLGALKQILETGRRVLGQGGPGQ